MYVCVPKCVWGWVCVDVYVCMCVRAGRWVGVVNVCVIGQKWECVLNRLCVCTCG